MCVDFQAINNIMINYKHPILRFHNMLDKLHESCMLSKIYLKSRNHKIIMKNEDEWKIIYKIKYSFYEWLVMYFKLTNTPSTFMRLMNHVLCNFLGKFFFSLFWWYFDL